MLPVARAPYLPASSSAAAGRTSAMTCSWVFGCAATVEACIAPMRPAPSRQIRLRMAEAPREIGRPLIAKAGDRPPPAIFLTADPGRSAMGRVWAGASPTIGVPPGDTQDL